MKHSIKKLVVLLLVAALALGVVACGPSSPSTGNNGGNETKPNKEVKFPLEEEVTLSLMVVDYSDNKDIAKELETNKLWQDIYKATNVKIEIITIPRGSIMNTINAKFMSNQEGDIILCPPAVISASDFSQMTESDLFLEISKYIDDEKLMPNFNNRVINGSEQLRAAMNAPDGGTYYIAGATGKTNVESNFWINNTWLKKMGKSVDDIKTIDDLEAVLTYFKNNDMNGNGDATDEVPYLVWDQDNNSHLDAFLSLYGIGTKWNLAKTADDGIYIEDGVVKFAYTSQNYKDAVKKLSDWYAKGLIYQQAFDADNGYNTLQKSNQIGLSTRAVPGSGTSDEWVALAPVSGTGYDAKFFVNPGYVSPTRVAALTRSCEEPEIALAWLDLFLSFETSVRTYYGEPEQGRYETVDGKLQINTLDSETEAAQADRQPSLFNLFQMFSSFNNDDYLNRIISSEKDIKRSGAYEMYKAAGALNTEIWPRPSMTDEVAAGINELKQDIFNTMATKRAAWITGKANIDAEWDAYIADMKAMKIDKYVELHQEAYNTYLAGIGK